MLHLLVLLILIFTAASLIENNLAILVISTFWLLIGGLLIKISFPKEDRSQSYRLWFILFTIYYLYMVVCNYVYVKDPYHDFFFHLDSLEFYTRIDSILRQSTSSNMYNWVLFKGNSWPGFAILSWWQGRVAYAMGETNNIVLQKSQIVFVCAMTVVFLYNMARIYLPHRRSWVIAITFGLLTHIVAFSGTYNRDPHILLIYTIGFYVFLNKEWRFRDLILLTLLGYLAAQFRLLNGIFFISFIAMYIFVWTRSFKSKIASIVVGGVFLVGSVAFVFLNNTVYEEQTVDKIEHYQEHHGEQFESAAGFTAVVSRLPAVFQPLANVVISQTFPFPPHRAIDVTTINEKQYLKFPLVIAQVYWMLVWGMLLYGLYFKKYRDAIPNRLKYALALAILFIVAVATGSYEYRRMLGAYPILYLSTAMIYFNISERKRKELIKKVLILIIGLAVLYLVLKI